MFNSNKTKTEVTSGPCPFLLNFYVTNICSNLHKLPKEQYFVETLLAKNKNLGIVSPLLNKDKFVYLTLLC